MATFYIKFIVHLRYTDSHAQVLVVQSSKYAFLFVTETEKWSSDLMYLQKFLFELLSCYRSYKYMDNILKNKDIKEQLKSKEEDFKSFESKY